MTLQDDSSFEFIHEFPIERGWPPEVVMDRIGQRADGKIFVWNGSLRRHGAGSWVPAGPDRWLYREIIRLARLLATESKSSG